ncbi:MAG: glycosyltransferase family 39 protein, partial [Pseudomonadota bacterium]|nr:glycosyltransferase family 39 protein [Pseudomonadota bacterium]
MDTQASRRRDPGIAATWLLLAILALALRLPDIGNPLIDLDEQFYLLVGDRMLHGAIPYVDIWDRKPVGLFLIYAAARAVGGDSWIGYQLVATAAAALTSGVIALLARRLATGWAGLCAGAVYLVWIELLGGRGGQAPVFYNGLIAGAALLTWLAIERPDTRWRHGIAAMLLVGLALQIKPTVVFEGAWFGVALLIGAWRRGVRPGALAGYALALVGLALAPTVIAYAVYLGIGHGDAWWFANVESIFLRITPPGEPIAGRLIGIALNLLIPAGAACFGLARLTSTARWVIGGWLVVAIVGLLAVPPYFNHYALPLIVPIAVLAGIGMAASRPFAMLVGVTAAALLLLSGYPHLGDRRAARHQVAALAA